MGNFEKIIIKKERDKIRRETLGKFFFDLAKSIKCPILSSRSYYRFIYRLALHEARQEMAGRVMIP